jgi:hypothetical protein
MKTFKCQACYGEFEKDWSDEEAAQEFKDKYGMAPPPDETGIVCEDCFQAMNKAFDRMPLPKGVETK